MIKIGGSIGKWEFGWSMEICSAQCVMPYFSSNMKLVDSAYIRETDRSSRASFWDHHHIFSSMSLELFKHFHMNCPDHSTLVCVCILDTKPHVVWMWGQWGHPHRCSENTAEANKALSSTTAGVNKASFSLLEHTESIGHIIHWWTRLRIQLTASVNWVNSLVVYISLTL